MDTLRDTQTDIVSPDAVASSGINEPESTPHTRGMSSGLSSVPDSSLAIVWRQAEQAYHASAELARPSPRFCLRRFLGRTVDAEALGALRGSDGGGRDGHASRSLVS